MKDKMIKACIFDLDGTIADTLESMAYVANEIMEKFSLKPQPADNFRYYSGEGADMLITACPLCMYNLKKNTVGNLPVYYFTELLAEALGVKEEVDNA